MDAGISGGGHVGPTRMGHAHGVGSALHPCGQLVRPPDVCSVPEILKYSIKNHTNFLGHLESFYFRDIFYWMDNSESRQKILFFLYLF